MSSRPVAGPSLPPGYIVSSNSHVQDDDDDDDEGDDVGPALPPPSSSSSQVASHNDGLSDAARAFVEREERQRRAEAEAQATREMAKTTRAEWMLAPPPCSSLSSLLQPTGAPLKARGFSQNTRVQKGGSLAAGAQDDEGTNLWTETPQERMDRMKSQVLGSSITHSTPSSDLRLLEEEGRRRMTLLRDSELKERVRKLDGETARTKSLLELHREARRRDFVDLKVKRKGDVEDVDDNGSRLRGLEDLNGSSDDGEERVRRGGDVSDDDDDEDDDDDDDDERRSRRRRGREESEEDQSRRKARRREERSGEDERRERRRHPSRSRSPEHRNRPRNRPKDRGEREDDKDRSHRRGRDERDREHRHHKSSSSTSSSTKRHHRHHHRPSPSSSPERPKSRSHHKDKGKPKSEASNGRKREADVGKTSATTMIWDRERAMSFVPLMDEKKKAKLLSDARALGDRFGSSNSGSKFL